MAEIHFISLGNPKSPPLLFLHGFMGEGADWNRIAKRLSSDFYCLLPDLPGHGSTPFFAVRSFGEVSTALAVWIRSVCTSPVSLVGYSMGGRIGWDLLLRYPELFSKGVIESSHPGIVCERERSERYDRDLRLFDGVENVEGLECFLKRWYQQPLFGKLSACADFSEVLARKKWKALPGWKEAQKALSVGNQPCLWQELPRLSVPTLYLSGEWDQKYREIGVRIEGLNDCIQSEVIPKAGHNIHVENREAYVQALANWL